MLRLTIGCPLIPVKIETDGNGDEFRVVPVSYRTSLYLLDVVVGPECDAICRMGFEKMEAQCLVDLNRLTVGGRAAQVPRIGVLEALGSSAPSTSPAPAQSWVQANFGDLEWWGHC